MDPSFPSRPRSRAPYSAAPRSTEFYELRLAPQGVEHADAHAPGTTENLVVAQGAVTIKVGKSRHELAVGDAILFDADVSHTYENPGTTEALMYLVMTYAERLA